MIKHHEKLPSMHRVNESNMTTLEKENEAKKIHLRQQMNHKRRGSYMSAHVLLNLLNKLRKSNKMRDLPGSLSLFRNKFNKFNNTRAQMLDSIYHMTLRLF